MPSNTPSRQAQPNEKMIEIRVRFWTNNIAETRGEIIPKHSWDCGVVHMQRNASHGIEPLKPKPFHSLMDMSAVIEEVLRKHGITFHHGTRSQKYYADGD